MKTEFLDRGEVRQTAFTIAFGKPSYKKMAVNLARSIERNSPETSFVLITDEPLEIGPLRNTEVRVIDPTSYGVGFSAKLSLDRLTPSAKALFIDADCLVYRSLEPLFVAFSDRPVGVLGVTRSDGEMFGDVASVCKRMKVPSLAHFNGGLYYIEKGKVSESVYARARELEPMYDDIGLVRLRGQPNDELLMAISLAEHRISPVQNSGDYYSDFQWWPVVERLNVIRRLSKMKNPEIGHQFHQSNFPAYDANAAVVHFLGHHVDGVLYARESMALRLARYIPFSDVVAEIVILPAKIMYQMKNALRPFYRKLFGLRSIKISDSRLIID